jgi:hypothetical protein
MGSCARRAGERRAHINRRRLKEGLGVNLSRSTKTLYISNHIRIAMVTHKSRLVNIPKSQLDSLVSTMKTLENETVMDQLEQSEIDIKNGRVRRVREFLKEL